MNHIFKLHVSHNATIDHSTTLRCRVNGGMIFSCYYNLPFQFFPNRYESSLIQHALDISIRKPEKTVS